MKLSAKILALGLTLFTPLTFRAQCVASGNSLATSYVSNNSSKGEMFNIVATNSVTIICFDLNLILGSSGSYEIYYKTGSYVGSENNAAAWTLLGSNANVPCVGFDFPSPMLIPINVFIPAGQTYGFYITSTNVAATTGIRYTNNAGYTNIASDANITITGGIGKAYPFLTNYNNRSFNGTVHYANGNILPVELSEFLVAPQQDHVHISWKTETESNNDHFDVERSEDGIDWKIIQTVKGAGNSQTPLSYQIKDNQPLWGVSYYRLSQTDFNGHKKTFDMRSLNRENLSGQRNPLLVFPNPASNLITIDGSQDELGAISLCSVLGKDLMQEVVLTHHASYVTIDISGLENELIILLAGERSALVNKQ